MTLEGYVVGSALILCWVSFGAFIGFTIYQLWATSKAHNTVAAQQPLPGRDALPAVDIAKWFESAAKLVDSLAKAGPGISALAASVLFLSIAAYAVSKDVSPDTNKAATSESAKH